MIRRTLFASRLLVAPRIRNARATACIAAYARAAAARDTAAVASAPTRTHGLLRRALTIDASDLKNDAPNARHPAQQNIGQSNPTNRPSPAMTTTAPKDTRTIAELVKADHAVVNNLFDCCKKATIDADKQHCMWKIIRELSVHAAVEEEILYPALKSLGAEGVKWADQSLKEHAELKKVLYDLDQIDADPKNAKTAGLFTKVEQLTIAHVKEEENELFPFMASKCQNADMVNLGNKYVSAKPYMPTRPHPDAPAGNWLGDRVLAAADYVRDTKRFAGVKDVHLGESPDKLPAMAK